MKEKSISKIYDWLLNLDNERYLKWHSAHKSFTRIKETENFVGSIFHFDEVINGFRINFKWEIVEIKPDEFIKLKAKIFFPIYILLSMKNVNGDTVIIHQLNVGFSFMGLEKIFDWLVSHFILTQKKVKALDRHATEEFKNLENLIKESNQD